jgi:hypothetical protein
MQVQERIHENVLAWVKWALKAVDVYSFAQTASAEADGHAESVNASPHLATAGVGLCLVWLQ